MDINVQLFIRWKLDCIVTSINQAAMCSDCLAQGNIAELECEFVMRFFQVGSVGHRIRNCRRQHTPDHSSEQVSLSSFTRRISGRIVSLGNIKMLSDGRNIFSYLYPDGRSVNPDLSWAVQATPEDHVKVIIRYHIVWCLNVVILGDSGTIWALLWDGLNLPAVQNMCREQ